jgi:hypothetical protein
MNSSVRSGAFRVVGEPVAVYLRPLLRQLLHQFASQAFGFGRCGRAGGSSSMRAGRLKRRDGSDALRVGAGGSVCGGGQIQLGRVGLRCQLLLRLGLGVADELPSAGVHAHSDFPAQSAPIVPDIPIRWLARAVARRGRVALTVLESGGACRFRARRKISATSRGNRVRPYSWNAACHAASRSARRASVSYSARSSARQRASSSGRFLQGVAAAVAGARRRAVARC